MKVRKFIIALALAFCSSIAIANNVEVICFNNGQESFHQKFKDVYCYSGYLKAIDAKFTYFLFGDCMVRYKNMSYKILK